MKKLDLHKVWKILNTLSAKQEELWEDSRYVYLMGRYSEYGDTTFESFLEYYSFKIEGDTLTVFNTDGVPYEAYNNNDVSYVPLHLLSSSSVELEWYILNETEKQEKQQELDKVREKEHIKREIERLNKQLNEL